MDEIVNSALIDVSLAVAVPLWIERLQRCAWSHIESRREALTDIIASKGDIIMFKSPKRGETAAAFNALAEALAAMSFVPGGVTFRGQHWQATHPELTANDPA